MTVLLNHIMQPLKQNMVNENYCLLQDFKLRSNLVLSLLFNEDLGQKQVQVLHFVINL